MAPAKRVSRKDVAKMANVSEAVVSYVMNDSNYVSEQKRKLVLEAIEKLGYEPNYFARSLKMKKSDSIGVIITGMMDETIFEYLISIEKIVAKNNYSVSFLHANILKNEIFNGFQSKHDGMMIIADDLTKEEIDVLNKQSKKEKPIIVLSFWPVSELNGDISFVQVMADQGIEQILKNFKESGVSNLGYLTNNNRQEFLAKRKKYSFISSTAQKLGIATKLLSISMDNIEQVEADIDKIIKKRQLPEAIIAETDKLALVFMGQLQKLGFEIPGRLRIAGFGDSLLANVSNPSLSSVKYDKETVLALMTEKLIEQINTGEGYRNTIGTSAIIRKSTM